MLFFIHYQGKETRVRVESRNQQTFISVDYGEEHQVDLTFFGNDCTFLYDNNVFSANIVGKKVDYTVWRPEGNLNFVVESEYRRIVGMLRGQDLQLENNVYAKMPGKIVKLLAKVGTQLEKGDPVLVMEAMKMENEIRANIAGQVKNVCISEGQAVETGTLLMEVEPASSSD